MTPKKPPVMLIALGGFGLLALLGTIVLMRGGGDAVAPAVMTQAKAATAPKTKYLQFVAAQFIPPRTVITQAMLREKTTETFDANAVTDRNQILGKLAGGPLFAGQAISPADVTLPLRRVVPANFQIPAGLRAVAVYVDQNSTTAGLVDIGDRVDVVATFKTTVDKQETDYWTTAYSGLKDHTLSRTVAQDLLVLAVDRSIDAPPPTPTPAPTQAGQAAPALPGAAVANPTPTPIPQPVAPGVVTKTRIILAAAPFVAERLAAANDSGVLHMTIRDPNSREQSNVPEAREYPTVIYKVAKIQKKDPPAFPMPMPPAQSLPPMPMPVAAPAPVNIATNVRTGPATPPASIASAPAIEREREITVIRGTEKTLVVVPRR